jgi:hypothetical protein
MNNVTEKIHNGDPANTLASKMDSIPPEIVETIVKYLSEVDKAFLSFSSTHFRRVVKRKYSLLASCVIDNRYSWLNVLKSWHNTWDRHSCLELGKSSSTIIFQMELRSTTLELRSFTLEQMEWIGYAVGLIGNSATRNFSQALRNYYSGDYRKVFYPALVRGAVDSGNLGVIDNIDMYSETINYLIQYATEKRNIDAFLFHQKYLLRIQLSETTKEWLREQPAHIIQQLEVYYQHQLH